MDAGAALARLLVQCAARPDIIGDVGYSDYRLISAGVVAALIRGGPDGIVEIARVHWINGHNRQVTQVFPFIWMQRQRRDPCRLLLHLFGNGQRNSVFVTGDQPETSGADGVTRSEEHTSELQSLMRISFAVFCLKQKMR